MKKKALIDYVKREKFDEFFTPESAVYPLLKHIPSHVKTIWECTDAGRSKITKVLKENGYQVVSTCFDFLSCEPDFDFDMIVTNPPYSLKDQFLERCYHYGKPFALLLPITALEGKKRQALYKKHGINVLLLDKRVEFTDKGRAWFAVAWFIWRPGEENNRIWFQS